MSKKGQVLDLWALICEPGGMQAARVGYGLELQATYLSVLRTASTSGMLALREMALSSFSSWLLRSRYLFLQQMGWEG